ncbi:MAG: hypothetical protein JXM69_02805 [Anaerolineae bacterium]|nr:hypothetical protein [Anaerolineae bacterium]
MEHNLLLDWETNPIDTLWNLAMLPKYTCAACNYEIDPDWEGLDSDEIRLRAQTTYAAMGHEVPFGIAEAEYIRYAKGAIAKTPLADRISRVIKAMRHEANYLEADTPCPRCHSFERTPVTPNR